MARALSIGRDSAFQSAARVPFNQPHRRVTISRVPDAILYPRFVEPRLAEALADSPAVLIHGPRQCGKTTLAKVSPASGDHPYVLYYDGETSARFGDRLHAVPISRLWAGP